MQETKASLIVKSRFGVPAGAEALALSPVLEAIMS